MAGMEDQSAGQVKARLVKWEGDAVETDEPEKHPNCIEVWEGTETTGMKLVFKREDNGNH